MPLPAEINWTTGILTVAGGGLGGFFTWMAARRKGKADDANAQAAMVKAAQEAAKAVIEALEARVTSLQSRVDSVESQLQHERQAWRDERHDLVNRLTAAQGENRQIKQLNDSLIRRLQAAGIDVPDAPTRMTEPALLAEPL